MSDNVLANWALEVMKLMMREIIIPTIYSQHVSVDLGSTGV